jgi:hypothetical protein
MRIPTAVAAAATLGAALSLSACTYVESDRPVVRERPAAVQTVPGATVVTPGVALAAPPVAIIVR